MKPIAIQANNLTKRYPADSGWFSKAAQTQPSVESVSLTVNRGEIFGLIGSNGAGKTTLAKMLCTLIAPSSGSATVAGIPLDLEHGSEIRNRVGLVVADERSFYWRLTGRQNLLFFAALYGVFGSAAQSRTDELLQAVGLQHAAEQRFDRYSSGMKQRLAIARGLLHQPEILFLDEPGRSLDQDSKNQIHELLLDLNQNKATTIFLITHDQPEAEKLCTQIKKMKAGKLIDLD